MKSKLNVLAFLSFFLSVNLQAQNDALPHTLLWKIEGNGLKSPSYLYGSMHTDNDRAFHLMDSVLIAFKGAQSVALELNFDSIDAKSLAKEIMLPNGTTWRDLFDSADYLFVKAEAKKWSPLPGFMLDRVKPVFVLPMGNEDEKSNPKKVLDMYFHKLAKKQKKPVIGLETAESQLAVFNDLTLKEQADMLLDAAKNYKTSAAEFEELLSAYENRNLNKLLEMTTSDTTMDEAFMKKMLWDRNIVMANGIDSIAKHQTVFTAVGAAHLPGDKGIIANLRRMGYKVSPVLSTTFLEPKYVKKQAK